MFHFENTYEGRIQLHRIFITTLFFLFSNLNTFGQSSFCDGFTAGFQSKARTEGKILVTPICPVQSIYCNESEFQCGYLQGVETAIEKIAVINSQARTPVYRSNTTPSNSNGVFQVPSFGRMAYEIEAAKSPEQRRLEAEARARQQKLRREEQTRNRIAREAKKQVDVKHYVNRGNGWRDLNITRHFDNDLSYRTSYETYYDLSDKNYFVSRLSYLRYSSFSQARLFSVGYGRIITPFVIDGVFETSADISLSAKRFNDVLTPIQEIRLSLYTSSFRNSFGLNWQITTTQQVSQGKIDATLDSFIGFGYKRRFKWW